jgi:hypothetical protein
VTNHMTLAARTFSTADQRRFAGVSGDHNPAHLDAVLARRTLAGAPIVHGVHLLLWVLDTVASNYPDIPFVRSLHARFDRFVYVDEQAETVLTNRGSTGVRLNVCVASAPKLHLRVDFGDSRLNSSNLFDSSAQPISVITEALDIPFEEMVGRTGRLALATRAEIMAAMFPAAAAWIGSRRIAALGASTKLVGMICPGLHSIFAGLSVETYAESDTPDMLAFRVTGTDPRFRMVRHEIVGGGLTGTLQTFARAAGLAGNYAVLVGLIDPTKFAGAVALIVGGSRGLGELTSKLVATGGGRVIITYQVGRTDAENVAQEIREAGGVAEILPYDARIPPHKQLANLKDAPTHVYYFATPIIFRSQSEVFLTRRFDDFQAVYVDGFWNLVQALRARQPGLSVFYPSSVFVSERPRNMTEYAMAKAAGEAVCADMNSALRPLRVTVRRLPGLPTDQTASITTVETPSPVETMLPIVLEVQSWPR